MLAPLRVAVRAAVAVTEPTGGPDRLPTGDPPNTVRPPEDTVEYVEGKEEDTTH
jgi:hypothetical protein